MLIVKTQFYIAITAPPGESGMGTVEGFFIAYLGFPVILVFWAIGYIWKREGWRSLAEIDVDTGRREHDWEAIHADRARIARLPMWKRMWYILF